MLFVLELELERLERVIERSRDFMRARSKLARATLLSAVIEAEEGWKEEKGE